MVILVHFLQGGQLEFGQCEMLRGGGVVIAAEKVPRLHDKKSGHDAFLSGSMMAVLLAASASDRIDLGKQVIEQRI
jgi:hypothetical protein